MRKSTEVVSIVSHQLKSPLSAIKNYLELLVCEDFGKVNEKQKEYLNDAIANTNTMISLVKNLLDVSRIEGGKMEFKLKKTKVEDLIRDAADQAISLARAKNCALNFEFSGGVPALNIDPVKIKQVISNFISNAIEYSSSKGNIVLKLKEKDGNIIFCCRDNGIGISDKDKDKIFTKFYRGKKAIVLEASGSGLGLFISKAIIERSGGKTWFKSKEGEGSVFCFSLPVCKDSAKQRDGAKEKK